MAVVELEFLSFFFQGKTQNSQLVDSARSAINYARPFIQILNLKHFCNATGRFMEALQPGSVFVHNRVWQNFYHQLISLQRPAALHRQLLYCAILPRPETTCAWLPS